MKIPFCQPLRKDRRIICPQCHSDNCWKYGTYPRKWFYSINKQENQNRKVQRHICNNEECQRVTFTIQEEDVLPYNHFLIPDLCTIEKLSKLGKSVYRMCLDLGLSRGVLKRSLALLGRSTAFLQRYCQEITNGAVINAGLKECLLIAMKASCTTTLKAHWFRHIYP